VVGTTPNWRDKNEKEKEKENTQKQKKTNGRKKRTDHHHSDMVIRRTLWITLYSHRDGICIPNTHGVKQVISDEKLEWRGDKEW
jgi:hypothetical protein